MNKRTLIASTLAFSLMASAGAGLTYAHDRGEGEGARDRMSEALQLTDEQRNQLKELWQSRKQDRSEMHETHRAEMQALQTLDPASPEFQAQMDKLIAQAQERTAVQIRERVEMQQKMREILTPEQQQKWSEMMQTRHGEGKGWGMHSSHHGKGEGREGGRHCD